MIDTLLLNGWIIDGTGAPAYPGSVGLHNGRIVMITRPDGSGTAELLNASANNVFDIDGLTITPGFIDQHTHSDITLLADGRGNSQVCQGVTLEIIGQCGFSAAPCPFPEIVKQRMIGYHSSVDVSWSSFGEYLDCASEHQLGLNVAAMVGHGALRWTATRGVSRQTTPEDVEQMTQLLRESCLEGGFGLSLGLEYEPGLSADVQELQKLAAVTGSLNLPVSSHIRNRDKYFDLAVAEMCSLSRNSDAEVIISHVNPKFGAPESAMEQILETVLASRSRGIQIFMDLMPDIWANTSMISILPTWAFKNGIEGVVELLTDDKMRSRIKQDLKPIWQLVLQGRWELIYLMHAENSTELIGKSFYEISKERKRPADDCLLDIIRDEGLGMVNLLWTAKNFKENDVITALNDPCCGIISDARTHSPDGVLKDRRGALATYGWAAHFLNRYVHVLNKLPLEDAIRRLTMLPATRFGLSDRGRIAPGAWADIVVFDPTKIKSTVSFDNPASYPSGIKHVFCNGQAVVINGVRTSNNPGKVLKSYNYR